MYQMLFIIFQVLYLTLKKKKKKPALPFYLHLNASLILL